MRSCAAGLATAATAFCFAFSSVADATMIYDPSTRSYVNYKQRYTKSRRVPNRYKRKIVRYQTKEKPGTIIVDTRSHYLYYVMGSGKAIRYGVGLGRTGFGWKGVVRVGHKKTWPAWTPPPEMVERDPRLTKFANGMPGGIHNPLGARALYLFDGGRDTLYRIHGTNEPWTIGLNVSSGCIRLVNDDVTDLHKRAKIGAKVIVK
ncbi:MAG TPA: L,D-transpeptidase [Afifellaceae bacterium]|nr:L,D-transpeptidase [Afifellaceae bacterium]